MRHRVNPEDANREFAEYVKLAREGATPREVIKAARSDGLNTTEVVRMLRLVFGHSLVEAKEQLVIVEENVSSLAEYQERLVEPLEQAFRVIEEQEKEGTRQPGDIERRAE